GWIPMNNMDANVYFTVLILGGLAVIIYSKLMLADITIKLPDSVPPSVAKAFTAIIPAAAALYLTAIIYYVFSLTIGKDGTNVIRWVQATIAEPFMNLAQGPAAVVIVTVMISILWFFGLHGPNILAPVLEGIWGQGQLHNVNTFQQGGMSAVYDAIEKGNGEAFRWVRGSFDSFSWFGGSGGTLTLLIVILVLSKRADYKTVAKLGMGPGLFNINEPVMFGLPIVLNPIMLIPFIVAPVVSTMIGFVATQLSLVNPVVVAVPWVVPPFLMSFLATGGDWRAPIVTLVSFAATLVIWAPFVIAANAQEASSLGE
ncbi:MAG: PTS transporter subunit EIIC, partial [Streptococcaceae bacterium]|nr:PTS transporter subunit EIIC [Streptococcaceae bacterium]